MDRQAILDKIAAMLKLQESSDFEGEANAAAAMIDKLCKKYGVTIRRGNNSSGIDRGVYVNQAHERRGVRSILCSGTFL
jgi:hydrogenase maturation factor HypF (carbamoyltransferase family)